MKLFVRNTVVHLLLVAYGAAGVLIEVGHHDARDIALHTHPAVAAHECGATEIHVPLDKWHDCLACIQSAQCVATTALHVSAPTIRLVCLGNLPIRSERPVQTDFLSSGKRGPPLRSL